MKSTTLEEWFELDPSRSYRPITIFTTEEIMSKEKVADDFFTIASRRIIGKSKSGYAIEALKLIDNEGKPHPVYHISLGPITEIFYDIADAAAL